jgi:hypothetical protein
MALAEFIRPKPSEIYCVLSRGKPKRIIIGDDPKFILEIITWPETYIKETALLIEEEFPKPYSSVVPVDILHGASNVHTNDPLDIIRKTLSSFIIRFKITDFLSFVKTIKDRKGLITHIQSTILSEAQQECIKNPLSYNLTHLKDINEALLSKAIEITSDFGVTINSLDIVIKMTEENNSLLNNFSKARAEGISSTEFEKALLYAKGEGISKLAKVLNIDDTILVYKIESIGQALKKSNYNFYTLNDQDKDITQKVLSLFYSK